MINSRTQNSINNLRTGVLSFGVNIILQFLNRTIFLYFLSVDYLGINGLFSNILSMLNLAELGVAGAMVYALYKPLAENDHDTINSIMKLYKQLYRAIGIFVLLVGLMITPFLRFIIGDSINSIDSIYLYYSLYVIDTGVSYFLTYKRSILICDQKQSVINIVDTIRNILVSVFQIVVLFLFKSYFAYLLVKILCTFLGNFVISIIAKKRYSYLSNNCDYPDVALTKTIKKNIIAMSFHKIGLAVVTGTDNIIITKFVSLSATGLYSNYTMVTNAAMSLLTQFFTAITASVGNLIVDVKSTKEKIYSTFKNVLFLNFVLFMTSSVVILNAINPFIEFWLGEKFLLDDFTVACIALALYTSGMRKTVMVFKDCAGLFWNDRYKPLLEAGANLAFSIPLAIHFGIGGTLLGTVLTNIFVAGLIESFVVYKNLFKMGISKYVVLQIKYFLICLLSAVSSYCLITCINISSSFGIFLFSCVISVAMCIAFTFLFMFRSSEIKYCFSIMKDQIFRRNNK